MKNMEYERQVNKGGCQWPHFQRCQDAWMTPVFHVTLRVAWSSETVGTSELQVAILNSCRTNLSVCPLCLSVKSASVKSTSTSEVPTDPYPLSVEPMFIWYLSRGWFRVIIHSWTVLNMKAGRRPLRNTGRNVYILVCTTSCPRRQESSSAPLLQHISPN
jgi:hypothetical protein